MTTLTRRGWLQLVISAIAARTVGVRVPGYHPYVTAQVPSLSLAEINTVTMRNIMPAITDEFYRATPLLAHLRSRTMQTWRA